MVAPLNYQTLADFREKVDETVARVNETGAAEVLTIEGEAAAVLLSAEAYDRLTNEAQLTSDVAVMQLSAQQIKEGKAQEAEAAFDGIRNRLLAMQRRESST